MGPRCLVVVCLFLAATSTDAAAATYYVSPSGSDLASGLSPAEAWKTTAPVNSETFAPGDRILFEGGKTFSGELYFDAADAGTPATPVRIGSYGTGRATILAGNGRALLAYNTAGLVISDLNLVGSGRDVNTESGILFWNDLPGDVLLDSVTVERVHASGFGDYGVEIAAYNGRSGYRNVRIAHVVAGENGMGGIFTYALQPNVHRNVYVGYSHAFLNAGFPGGTNSSGNGILLSGVDGGTIEHSVAHGNGWRSNAAAGPIGIWTYESTNITIQFNESYGNKTGGTKDGGGFSLDNSTSRSVLQYNYSHDNDGAGFLLAHKWDDYVHTGNVVRWNVSQNDGRKNNYAAILTWGRILNAEIYNNTAFLTYSNGGLRGLSVRNNSIELQDPERVHFRNNIVQTQGAVPMVDASASALDASVDIRFEGNLYFSSGAAFKIYWKGVLYGTLAAWRTASGQERVGGLDTGLSVDPQLMAPGTGKTLGNATLLKGLWQYRLKSTSPAIDAGLNLSAHGIDTGPRDFFGGSSLRSTGSDIGAHEFNVACTWTIAPASASVPLGGGAGDISVTGSAAECGWAALSSAAWLTATPQSGDGSGTVQFSAAPNGGTPRTGTITIANRTFTVSQEGSANVPPSVAITAPASGATYAAPASVGVSASASDTDGTIAHVRFYVGPSLVSTDTSAPYGFTWNTAAPGTYKLTAVATDELGASTTSNAITVVIEDTGPLEPGEEVVLWAAEAPVAVGWTRTPDATAAGGARLQNADLGAAKITTAIASPARYFELTFHALAFRPYRLWIRGKATGNLATNDSVYVQFDHSLNASGAVAYRIGTTSSVDYNLEECSGCGLSGWGWEDNGWGGVGILGPLFSFTSTGPQRMRIQVREDGLGIDQIVLSSRLYLNAAPGSSKGDATILSKTDEQGVPNTPPAVSLTSPSNGATVTAPATVNLAANATDADGTVTKVEFLVNGTVVAEDLTAPWAATWNADTAGVYTVTARARDGAGATTTSAAVTLTVEAPAAIAGQDVVLWAADATVAFDWSVIDDATAAGGRRLQNANLGATKIVTALERPTKYFEMTFNALAGRGYRLWIRGKALSNAAANDSVHVQFDGSLDAAGAVAYRIGTTSSVGYNLEECSGCGLAGWGWEDNGWGAIDTPGPLVYFASSGLQRIRIQVREDGLGIDQIVLSSSRWVNVRPGTAKNDTSRWPKTDEQDTTNQRPAVSITSPSGGASFIAPVSVDIIADAADTDGHVTRVDFLANGSLLGSDTAPPWVFTWSAATPGSYTLTARAHDNAGAMTTSNGVTVTVSSAPTLAGEDIVLYAAEAPVTVGWSRLADATAAGGSRLQNLDGGVAKIVTALAAPSKYFEMTFNALAGRPYRLWIRGKALSNSTSNDSVHVQFDWSLDESGANAYRIGTTSSLTYVLEECSGCGLSGWGWEDTGWGAVNLLGPVVYFARDGAQKIRVQIREDGLGIDQIVLSSVTWVNTRPGAAKNDTKILPKQ